MKAQQRQVKVGDQAVLGLIIIFHLANYKHECKVIHQLAAYPLCVIYCMPSALAPLSPVETEVTSAERASMYPGNRTKCKKMAAVRFRRCQIFSCGRVAIRTLLVSDRWNCHTCKFSWQSCVR